MIHPITSSMFSHIGYDADSMTLTVRYHASQKQQAAGEQGDLWVYKHYAAGLPVEPPAAPEEGWGRWFLANIRGRYEGVKMPTEEEYAANCAWREGLASRPAPVEGPNERPLCPEDVEAL